MAYLAWTAATGCLLSLMSLSYGWISRAPVPVFGLYLVAGIVCGPWVLGVINVDIAAHASLISRVTEIAMAASCLNYIAYAYTHGLAGASASAISDATITIVTLSVLVHGISVTPLLTLRNKRMQN